MELTNKIIVKRAQQKFIIFVDKKPAAVEQAPLWRSDLDPRWSGLQSVPNVCVERRLNTWERVEVADS
jgi:hypothetical protein